MPAGKQSEIPESSGIYQIRCKRTGKIYIGSAVNLRVRWENHRRNLRSGTHHNPYLQHAWRLYGEIAFEFVVLELTAREALLETEQRWIEQTHCIDPGVGFNIKLEATSAGDGVARTWVGFRDPEGNPVMIVGLTDFCRCHGLDYRSMHRLAQGRSKLKSYKGWTHERSVRRRAYIKTHSGFIDPNGCPVAPIRNLAAFCRAKGLEGSHMTALASGRIVSYRGWTHVRAKGRLPPLVHKGFVAPGGAVTRITNLSAFCRAAGLCEVHMHELKSGKRPSHKGWTWKSDADRAFE
ncbi:MAG: GIY-YIG nuclease family protein [Gammaproteobacteria bacterium]|nr:GIY-YIG nuclease family protein [Gammaproteobacteria bacterium]